MLLQVLILLLVKCQAAYSPPLKSPPTTFSLFFHAYAHILIHNASCQASASSQQDWNICLLHQPAGCGRHMVTRPVMLLRSSTNSRAGNCTKHALEPGAKVRQHITATGNSQNSGLVMVKFVNDNTVQSHLSITK